MSTPNNTQLGNKSVQEKRRNSGHCPALQRGAMTETLTRITITPSDMLMFAAVAMLPFDGTKIGIPLPYWTPISPWLFTLYTIINWRYLRDTARRFLPFFLFRVIGQNVCPFWLVFLCGGGRSSCSSCMGGELEVGQNVCPEWPVRPCGTTVE